MRETRYFALLRAVKGMLDAHQVQRYVSRGQEKQDPRRGGALNGNVVTVCGEASAVLLFLLSASADQGPAAVRLPPQVSILQAYVRLQSLIHRLQQSCAGTILACQQPR